MNLEGVWVTLGVRRCVSVVMIMLIFVLTDFPRCRPFSITVICVAIWCEGWVNKGVLTHGPLRVIDGGW